METIQWKVEGMTCANCALTINKYLEKQGQQNIRVNPIDGDVRFDVVDGASKASLKKGIEALGYTVAPEAAEAKTVRKKFPSNHLQRFLFCLPFTLVLLLHMLQPWIPLHFLMNPWVQLGLTLPVYIVGMQFFGRSAIKSLRNGIPNMNVLIALGATAAFIYSLTGTVLNLGPDYLFYETTATIITLVFLGNYLEDASMASTQRALKGLIKSQKVMANMIAFDEDHQELIFPLENSQLKVGDLVLINSGDQVPIDCKILWGEVDVNESILTGESLPVHRIPKEKLIGGSIVANGTVRAQVTATGNDTVLAGILQMVKMAQGEKPPVQLLADKISAIFVPVVIAIAVITLLANWIYLGSFGPSLMRSIAVLVIACPCAMGLATPAAIAVGLGRAARSGILFRNASSLETFRTIRQVVFDKTGTLTTGEFVVKELEAFGIDKTELQRIIWSLEKHSSHPIARCLSKTFASKNDIRWVSIEEIKGQGMRGKDKEGNIYEAGSYAIAATATNDTSHQVYVLKNNDLIGWIDLSDEIRPEAQQVLDYLRGKEIKTILLSGDNEARCAAIASALKIDTYYFGQSPEQKMDRIAALSKETPTAMVGDGINDAPALAKATIGISLSDASQLAMQHADVVLMNQGLKKLPLSLGLGKHTYKTIQQNLFWAFAYNIIAIPVAALGFLTPGFSALVMGLSDVVLGINSVRLFVKKVV